MLPALKKTFTEKPGPVHSPRSFLSIPQPVSVVPRCSMTITITITSSGTGDRRVLLYEPDVWILKKEKPSEDSGGFLFKIYLDGLTG